ncbi:hypothetical protein HPC38_02460 [Pasteurellaceae bacterium HPA106]|uniref:P22AR C-terminal domain-containing protein n=1 Tax=Spirabiliibacterium pneumoniae TaxID=221400 RepID=UPI001AAD9556|nr:P22AR C-terminal domain-containing protein [Spirabiliibacterium pneumoniae]MBE2895742.1 hypothetical protein [Spirabiliibacterium pneumoniae]
MTTLTFKNTAFSVVNQNNQIWLAASDIGKALAYKNPIQGITLLFNRYQDEFTPNMTALIEMQTNGGMQKVRIFSLRGAHLIGMLSHTKVAKDFRRWVLDILDKEVQSQSVVQSEPPQKLSAEHQQFIKDFVKNRTLQLPKDQQAKGAIVQWSALKSHFGKTYKEIDDTQFIEAVGLLARLPLEGELLDGTTALLPKNDFRTSWNDDEIRRLASFWCATYEMHGTLKQLEPILNMLGSTFHPRVFSQVHEYKSLIRSVHSRLVRDIDHLQYADPHDRHWQYCLETINRFNKPRVKRLNF